MFSQEQWRWWLPLAVLALVGLALVLRAYERRRGQRVERVVEAHLAERLLVGYDPRMRTPLFWLTFVGFAALLLALAQPRLGQAWVEVEKRSRDVLVLLDTSQSMNAADPPPSRLARAKQKIESLIERAPADRFGLVAFSGVAELQCPLTLDHNYYRAILDAVDTHTLSAEGTDLEAALEEAVRVFADEARDSDGGEGARAIVILSDGEMVSGDAAQAAQEAQAVADIFVLAIGSREGGTVMRPDWMRNAPRASERSHVSKLEPETLRAVASHAEAYVPLAASNADVDNLLAQLEEISARSVASEVRERMTNRYQWPLALAFLCFAAEGLWLVLMPHLRTWRMRRAAREEAGHA